MKKTALITGSRRGIGLAIAHALAKSDYKVILSGTSSAEQNHDLVQSFLEEGCEASYLMIDISRSEHRRSAVEYVQKKYGRIDLLVNNAGVAPSKRLDILETTEESFDQVMDINLRGNYFMCQIFARAMLAFQKQNLIDYHPKIINISSLSAYTASITRGEYCISKAGLSMVTALFASRLAESGIGVFEIQPGIIETDMTVNVKEKYQAMIQDGLTPLKRMGHPNDVAQAVLAVCSGQLDFCVGQTIQADGGFHLRRL